MNLVSSDKSVWKYLRRIWRPPSSCNVWSALLSVSTNCSVNSFDFVPYMSLNKLCTPTLFYSCLSSGEWSYTLSDLAQEFTQRQNTLYWWVSHRMACELGNFGNIRGTIDLQRYWGWINQKGDVHAWVHNENTWLVSCWLFQTQYWLVSIVHCTANVKQG